VTALVSGLWLLGAGSVSLIRRLRGWWRVLAIPAALAVLLLMVYPLTAAVHVTNRPATSLGIDTPANHGFAYEDVSFPTRDGVRLSAWYVTSRNGAAVVLLHGSGSTRSAVLAHGTVLARHGYGVLLMDTRGHGLSDGDAMDFGWYGDLDIDAAVSFVMARPDVVDGEVGIVGLSMGGEQAIAAAGVDRRIRAVVAEGVTGMQAADHGWLEQYGLQGSIQQMIDRVMYGAAGVLSGADRPMALREAIRAAASRPVLLIAAGATVDEGIAGRWFRQASPRTVELWIVPGAGHTAGLATHGNEWEDRVTGFLEAALSPEDGAS
jgi:pimeloyl-ACP methyl ester carboxylesterase